MRTMPSRVVTARAPTRIDLGGGWTDVPPYCDREGGFVCNVAIARYSTASISSAPGGDRSPKDSLIAAVLKRTGATGLTATLSNDFPVAAGLGGSSAASAALLGALNAWKNNPLTPQEIAEEGRRIEVEELGIAGGRQDHYAAAFGGALALTFTTTTAVRRIELSADTAAAFVQRALLVYTGESRISGATITAVLGAYEAGDERVVGALARMKALAGMMAAHLEHGDVDAVGEAMREHWEFQRSLHDSIPTARIDEIISTAYRAGATGAKAMGASGGGCVLILGRAAAIRAVRHAVAPLGEILDFTLDHKGLTVLENGE